MSVIIVYTAASYTGPNFPNHLCLFTLKLLSKLKIKNRCACLLGVNNFTYDAACMVPMHDLHVYDGHVVWVCRCVGMRVYMYKLL